MAAAALADLEAKQTRILDRIAQLESRLASNSVSSLDGGGDTAAESTEKRLSAILLTKGVSDFSWKRVPFDYYDQSLECRRQMLGASRIEQLCKSIVMVMHFLHLFFLWHFVEQLYCIVQGSNI
jgi:hypothetical protein